MMIHPLPIAGKLPIKTLVATNKHTYTYTQRHTGVPYTLYTKLHLLLYLQQLVGNVGNGYKTTHAHVYTHTHTHTHTHTQCVHAHIQMYTHKCTYTHTHTYHTQNEYANTYTTRRG